VIREAVVAGQFYPRNAVSLRKEVEGYLCNSGKKQSALGVIAPHAGYIYSGAVVGKVFAAVEVPKTVVILAPNHTGMGASVGLMAVGAWRTPLGDVKIEEELAKLILGASKDIKEDSDCHSSEHSIEVQLPFLQYLQPELRFVPISMSARHQEVCLSTGQALAQAIQEFKGEVLIVASTDMTHYESQKSAEIKDRMAIDAILNLDPSALLRVVQENQISMCGAIPTATMLYACKELGAKSADLIEYTTSGEVSKDYQQVVGYAGFLIKS